MSAALPVDGAPDLVLMMLTTSSSCETQTPDEDSVSQPAKAGPKTPQADACYGGGDLFG